LAGCGSTPVPKDAPAPDPVGALDCTLVLLKTGPRRDLSEAERSRVFGGHFGNMQRLARERQLLLAGPFGEQKSDPGLRGLFVIDTDDPDRARQLAETDPGFRAGVFTFEFHAMSTGAPLRAFLAAELAAQEEATRANRTMAPGEGGRGYVWLTAEDGDAAFAALDGHPAVLCAARLDESRAFVLLDCGDVLTARAVLGGALEQIGTHRLDDWFGSGRLADLPRLARAGG
jgi:uncharacterized protein YciI